MVHDPTERYFIGVRFSNGSKRDSTAGTGEQPCGMLESF
jgi:hypothetical protein